MFENWQKLVSPKKIYSVPDKYLATYYPNRMRSLHLHFSCGLELDPLTSVTLYNTCTSEKEKVVFILRNLKAEARTDKHTRLKT